MAEDISPPFLPPPEPAPEEKRKRWVAGGVVVLVVAGLAVGASIAVRYMGKDGVEKLGEYFRQLPLTEEGGPQVVDEPGEDQGGLPESEGAGEEEEAAPAPTPDAPYNLAVTIQYRRQSEFTLEIVQIERTTEAANIQNYQLAEDSPYSTLQILDEQGRVMAAERFQVITEVLVDGVTRINPVQALPDSVSRFTLSVPQDAVPVKVRLVTPRGKVLDEENFTFDDLPVIGSKESLLKEAWLRRLAKWRPGVRQARGAEGGFNIVVISSVPQTPGFPPLPPDTAVLNAVANGIRGGMLAIDPWSVYAGSTNVQVVANVQDLGCRTISFQGGSFPLCPDQGKIQQVLAEQGIQWNAVVVVAMDAPCNCGTSGLGTLMTAVGTYATGDLVTHEFGHAVAVMADEYYGDLGLRGPGGPNCFGSMEECRGVISGYASTDGVCSQGCNNPDTVRPANLIMYGNTLSKKFGPVETCLMGRSIAAVLGEEYEGDCGEEGPSDDAPRGPGPASGWYREY